ncbi:uncharacterized protein LOC114973361 isoform X4 [Acropora millepora]|uniref:uncharacterized protein LOC114973361 isoform X4 n=1 Tax=Acropora millepora TaxID=45264 RepID=UPI001CF56BA1|nr:uncharacterized protein LOC114973361 isoform X4 [Acropora millepora]
MGGTVFDSRKKSSKRKNSKDDMLTENDNSNSVEMKEFASSTSQKNMASPTNNKDIGATSLLEKRRVSASVSEIRDLYSALQELVPGSGASSLSHQVVPEEEIPRDGVSSNRNSPRPRRSPNNSITERSTSPSLNNEEDSMSIRVRRLLPVIPRSTSKGNLALDVNANKSATKNQRTPTTERLDSSDEASSDTQTNPTRKRMGRRGSSGDVLFGGGSNKNKASKNSSAMVRSASNIDLSRAAEAKPKSSGFFKLDRFLNSNLMGRRGSEGLVVTTKSSKQGLRRLSPLKLGRRGSGGDIVTTESAKSVPIPPSPLTLPPQDTDLRTVDQSPGTTVNSSPKQSSQKNAMNKFSHLSKEETPSAGLGPKELTAEEEDSTSQPDSVDGAPKPKTPVRLESQMDLLLNSLNELHGSPKEKLHASMSDPVKQLDQRRVSLRSEMQKLLGALQELCPGSDSDSLGELEARSRNGSVSCERATVERESLDQLEAYFTEKLRDATRAERASKTPSEKSSESEVIHSDKEDGEGKERNLSLSSQKPSVEVVSVDEGIDLIDHPLNGSVKRPKSKEDRDQFANQVNKKLQDWLEKAMMLAQKEKGNLHASFATSESEEFKYDSHDSDESDGNKDKEPQKIKRNLFNKLSFLRRGEKSRGKNNRHRRTRSMHDVTVALENELNDQDFEESTQSETTTAQGERKSSTVTRTRSLHTIGQTRNKGRSKQVKEAEDMKTAGKDLHSTTKANETAEGELDLQQPNKDNSFETASKETPWKTENFKTERTTPRIQLSDKKTLKSSDSKKRLGRLPTNLPMFYHPDKLKYCTTQETTHQNDTESPSLNRKKFVSQNGVIYTGMEDSFYTEKKNGKKLRKTSSDTVPYPGIFTDEGSNYFFGDRFVGEVTLVYPSISPPGTLRRCASVDSFLNAKELQDSYESESNCSCHYGNSLTPDDAMSHHMSRRASDDQSVNSSYQPHIWDTEVII